MTDDQNAVVVLTIGVLLLVRDKRMMEELSDAQRKTVVRLASMILKTEKKHGRE